MKMREKDVLELLTEGSAQQRERGERGRQSKGAQERSKQSKCDARVPATDGMGDIQSGHHGSSMIGEWPGLQHKGCGGGGGDRV